MKFLLIIVIVIAMIIAILLIIALILKKEYTVVRETAIYRSKMDVFEYIKLLKNQNHYSKWATMDPNMKQEFIGTDGTVGFVSAWDSNEKNVGKGEQKIVSISEGEKVEYDLHFIKPFDGRAMAYMSVNALSQNQSKVTWGFRGKMKYPMNLMLLFMNMEDMIGRDLSIGLSNLKRILEDKK